VRSLDASAICCALVTLAGACSHAAPPEPAAAPAQIHGVKTYLNQDNLQARYPSYDTLVTELRQGGVDAVFTTLYEGRTAFYASQIIPNRDKAIDLAGLRESAKKQNVKFGAICQIFYDADTLAERKDLVPIDQHGSGEFVNWQRLVCPSDPGYRQYKLSIVKEIASTIRPDVVSLDFMRFPTTWEIIPADAKPASIRNYCFCDRCMRAFQETARVVVPPALRTIPTRAAWILANHNAEWVTWKTGVITSFVEEAAREVRAIDPAIEVSVHVVPWAESVFDNALVWNAAQDVTALSRHVDYLSPMIYHKLIGRPTDYIRTLTAELATKTKRKILPSIQTAEIVKEGQLSADEFKQSLDNALASPSAGTLIFHWGELRPDEQAPALRREKREIFKAAAERR
jgi:uncharacterized lipoprotein YddW (UPF0748 family)